MLDVAADVPNGGLDVVETIAELSEELTRSESLRKWVSQAKQLKYREGEAFK